MQWEGPQGVEESSLHDDLTAAAWVSLGFTQTCWSEDKLNIKGLIPPPSAMTDWSLVLCISECYRLLLARIPSHLHQRV